MNTDSILKELVKSLPPQLAFEVQFLRGALSLEKGELEADMKKGIQFQQSDPIWWLETRVPSSFLKFSVLRWLPQIYKF